MKPLLLILLIILSIPSFGHSSDRPQSIVIPISSIGEVSESRKQILQNTLTQELSKHFQILPQDQFERVQEKVFEELDYEECTEDQCIVRIQEVLQIENVFNLQIIGEEGDTQLNLKWMNLDEKKNREDYCEGCKTKELRNRVRVLVNLLIGNKIVTNKPVVESPKKILPKQKVVEEILYWRKMNGVFGWFQSGNPKIDDRYIGPTTLGIPEGRGILSKRNGERYEGEFLNGLFHGNGTYIHKDGRRVIGDWKNQQPFNSTNYDKYGNVRGMWDNGNYKKNLNIFEFVLVSRLFGCPSGFWVKDDKSTYTNNYLENSESCGRYIGEYIEDEPHGNGVFIFQNGKVFKGQFLNGDSSSIGEFTDLNGKKSSGRWEMGFD